MENKRYRVVITQDAIKDIDDIFTYIAFSLAAPVNAGRLCQRIRKAILNLELYPYRYALFTTDVERRKGYRKIPVGNYLIIYLIREDMVVVTNVLYGASKIIDKLHQ